MINSKGTEVLSNTLYRPQADIQKEFKLSDVAIQIDKIVGLGLAVLLKKNGFRKAGRTWHKSVNDDWQIINVQASASNSRDQGKFAVNLGVYSAQVAALAGQKKPEKVPKEFETTVRERLGSLAYEYDHWWTVEPTSDLNEIASDVEAKMQKFGLHWLDAHLEVAMIAAHLQETPSLHSFSAALLAWDKEEALRRYEAAIAARPAAKAHYVAWAVKSGLVG
jgi:hypothetical protein